MFRIICHSNGDIAYHTQGDMQEIMEQLQSIATSSPADSLWEDFRWVLNVYGFVLNVPERRNRPLPLGEFADVIEKMYDITKDKRTGYATAVLRRIATMGKEESA